MGSSWQEDELDLAIISHRKAGLVGDGDFDSVP